MGNAQHQGVQPQPFDYRGVVVFYGLVTLLVAASLCPAVVRKWAAKPSNCCSRRHGGVAALSRGEVTLAAVVLACLVSAFCIAWGNMVDAEDDAPFLDSYVFSKVALITRCLGHVNEAQLALLLLPVTRNSIWLYGLSLPFERALRYHRLLGRATFVLMTVHMGLWWAVWLGTHRFVANALKQTGYVASAWGLQDPTVVVIEVAWLVAACVLSLQFVRRHNFELFLFTHYTLLLVVAAVAFHSWFAGGYIVYLLIGPMVLYIVDRALRAKRGCQPTSILRVEAVPGGTVLEYSLPRMQPGDDPQPGQYAFLCIPEISRLQWHPVSFSSVRRGAASGPLYGSEYNTESTVIVTHHIKDMGSGTWSGELRRLADCIVQSRGLARGNTDHSLRQSLTMPPRGRIGFAMRVRCDGPYGVSFGGVDVNKVHTLVMVAGGVGVTPLMCAMQALLEFERTMVATTALQMVDMVWVVRHPRQVSWFDDIVQQVRSRVSQTPSPDTRLDIRMHIYATCSTPPPAATFSAPATGDDAGATAHKSRASEAGASSRGRPFAFSSASGSSLQFGRRDSRHAAGRVPGGEHNGGESTASSRPSFESSFGDGRALAMDRGYHTCRPDLRAHFCRIAMRRDRGIRTSAAASAPAATPVSASMLATPKSEEAVYRRLSKETRPLPAATSAGAGTALWVSGPASLMQDARALAPECLGQDCVVHTSHFVL